MVYTAIVMTENAFYPVFLLATLALVTLLERPVGVRHAAFFAALALAYLTRTQAVVIAAAAVTAPFLIAAWTPRGFRTTLWSYRWLYGILGSAVVLAVAAQVVRGRQLTDLLGAYAVVGESGYDVGKALHFFVYHVAELDLYLGVIPFAVAIVLTVKARSLDRPLQVMLAATLSLFAWCVIVVGTFASRFADRIQERNMFVVAPLFLILVLGWIGRRAPRPRATAVVAGAVSALLLLAIPFERFVTTSAVSDTLMLLPWWAILEHTGRHDSVSTPSSEESRLPRCSCSCRHVMCWSCRRSSSSTGSWRSGRSGSGPTRTGSSRRVPGRCSRESAGRRATGSIEPFRPAGTWPSCGLEPPIDSRST